MTKLTNAFKCFPGGTVETDNLRLRLPVVSHHARFKLPGERSLRSSEIRPHDTAS